MRMYDIIHKKRDGFPLTDEEISFVVQGCTDGSIPDYQLSALMMAIYFQGLDPHETAVLTDRMAHSGDLVDLSGIQGFKADKHSTGGVGDKTTMVVAPIVAACGVPVAKMSGRGLGHTGGTVDKLESIPGFCVELSPEEFIRTVNTVGACVVGQSGDLAPADKVLYALRDVTGTVDCMPLIVSSILSKKLAAGCDVVVLDVKYGSGALAGDARQAKELAEFMVRLGSMSGRKFSALVTGMEQPLGAYVGNALEVEEAIQVLSGQAQGDLKTVALELGAYILRNAGAVKSVQEGRALLNRKLNSGEGLKKLAAMIQAQGGDPRVVYDTSLLPKAQTKLEVKSFKSGYLSQVATNRIGEAAKLLGAGREKKTDVIDPAVGIIVKKRIGDAVEVGDVLCQVFANPASDADGALHLLNGAFTVSAEKPEIPPLIEYVVE